MYRHGMFGTRIHKIWDGMIQRCHNKNCKDYKNWGGRGIKVCKRWRDFINFYKDVGEPPTGKSLGRIDNNKGYSKENCEWQTWTEQHRNKRTNKIIKIGNETKNQSAWIEHFKINPQTFSYRHYVLGWDVIKSLTKPIDKRYSRPQK